MIIYTRMADDKYKPSTCTADSVVGSGGATAERRGCVQVTGSSSETRRD